MTPFFGEISDPFSWIVVGSIFVAALAIIGTSVIVRVLRNLRTELADELKRELSAKAEPKRVDIQQPITTRVHTEYATREALEQVEKQAHGRMNRERQEFTDRVEKLEGKIDRNTDMTAEMRGEVRQINQNVSLLQTSMTQFMRDGARSA